MTEKLGTRILIVDDCCHFRRALEHVFDGHPQITVVDSAWNGHQALERLSQIEVDVVLLDLHMPGLTGLETLDAIMQLNQSRWQHKQLKVIMLSANTTIGSADTIEAHRRGAIDFIIKPKALTPAQTINRLKRFLLPLFEQLNTSNHAPPPTLFRPKEVSPNRKTPPRVILIGSSTGGPKALNDILPDLCRQTDLPILIVQHMPANFTAHLARALDQICEATVQEASNGMKVEPNQVYIALGGHHMALLRKGAFTNIVIHDAPPVHNCRPSVDILFQSAAQVFNSACLAVILTGMGCDGTDGAKALRSCGAEIIVQDRESCVVWGMPRAAVEAGVASKVIPLHMIPGAVGSRIRTTSQTVKRVH